MAVACIIFSYFWRTKGHITHSKSDISICNKRSRRRKKKQKANNFQTRKITSMKCFTEINT
ncbi:hypothetical protein D0U00_09640 [Leclercia adecarboxylata]|nr:hypothetical protein D0U00_09640 [Leclercia adecarboxylata]